ncbi:MAG: hypothetical protein MJZ18_05780 [Bacteroidales bacterium]|nr:hypothetical protein [Bacteroidales bacterium]
MHRYIILSIALLCLLTDSSSAANKRNKEFSMGFGQIYVAPKIGINIPCHIGRETDEIGFNDVASNGFTASLEGLWMQNPQVGVGGELGYMTNPYKEQFWGNLITRGSFEASYKAFSAMGVGRLFIGERRLKPMLGVAAGAYLIKNNLNFESKWQGTGKDESVNYKTNIINPAYSGEIGLLYHVGNKSFVSISVRLNIIPRLKEEIKTTTDPYTFEERHIALNPHGNENNIEFKVGIYFGVRDRIKK